MDQFEMKNTNDPYLFRNSLNQSSIEIINQKEIIGDDLIAVREEFNSSNTLDRRGVKTGTGSRIRFSTQKAGMGPSTKSQVNFKANNDLNPGSYTN
jgi:hypothetical protein